MRREHKMPDQSSAKQFSVFVKNASARLTPHLPDCRKGFFKVIGARRVTTAQIGGKKFQIGKINIYQTVKKPERLDFFISA